MQYSVYLETAEEGLCLAHVPALPGCVVRANDREAALKALPDVVRAYHAWLRSQGEPAPLPEEPLEFEIAGESIGFGPFNPGDAAALFPPDLAAVTPEEMEWYFRLAEFSRADLLALVRDLPEDLLSWQPQPDAFSIRRVLRHIGNAEEWYVSRLVSPESLPAEWAHDEDLPILEFLTMERRTAVERLRRLTGQERSQVVRPEHWTNHPEEEWTARKALRRFLEHEREHTGQVREILASASIYGYGRAL